MVTKVPNVLSGVLVMFWLCEGPTLELMVLSYVLGLSAGEESERR